MPGKFVKLHLAPPSGDFQVISQLFVSMSNGIKLNPESPIPCFTVNNGTREAESLSLLVLCEIIPHQKSSF